MAPEANDRHPSPPYSGPLEEIEPPSGTRVRVRFDCPHCGVLLERVARQHETRWYLPICGTGHFGIGVQDTGVERLKFRRR